MPDWQHLRRLFPSLEKHRRRNCIRLWTKPLATIRGSLYKLSERPESRLLVEAGVDCVEHGILNDEDGIALMKERGTWFVAYTLSTQLCG